VGTLVKLEALVLANNSLIGNLPSSLKNCNNLIMLDVSESMLSGPIPSWLHCIEHNNVPKVSQRREAGT